MGEAQGPGQGSRLEFTQGQRQKTASAVIQGVELLALPTESLDSYLAEAALGNPFLELDYRLPPPLPDAKAAADPWEEPESCPPPYRRGERLADEVRDADDYLNLRGVPFETETLTGSLLLQLSLRRLGPLETAIGREIIGNIDDRGYFVGNLTSICRFYEVDPPLGEEVLRVVQGFFPPGIAARDLCECLCLQLPEEMPNLLTTRRMVREDLELLARGKIAQCAKKHRLTEEETRAILCVIRTLNPRPGEVGGEAPAVAYTAPDLIIRRVGRELTVSAGGEGMASLRLSPEYLSMLRRTDLSREDMRYLRARLGEARSLMHSLSLRRESLRRFALALLRLQGGFFELGPAGLAPLTMKRMAEELGVNVSSVSRTVQGKYMDTPWGMFPFKYFFSGACGSGGGEAVSVRHIKERLRVFISEEDPATPLSDTQLCALLTEAGLSISRRTVTKYRQAMGLDSQGKRKR